MRQYIGILAAVVAYYVIHEGAHFIYALSIGVFKQINFMGIGMQIETYVGKMTDLQFGIFNLLGSVVTFITAYVLVLLIPVICRTSSKTFKACMYYITIAMLLLDPIYLSILCDLFGRGDMNGISVLLSKITARIGYGILLMLNVLVFWKLVLPKYKTTFSGKE